MFRAPSEHSICLQALNFHRTDRRRVPGTLWPVCTREIVIEAADHQHHSNRRTVLFFAFDSNTRPDSEEDVVERV